MDKMISRFTEQLREAIEIGQKSKISAPDRKISNILICGMGGSGIGGDFISEYARQYCPYPVKVNKSYDIPAYVNESTLAICSSYSGNTEETLAALGELQEKNAYVICVSSGGKLLEIAREKGYDFIQVPNNWASPRACLGYSVVAQLFIFNKLNWVPSSLIDDLEAAIHLLDEENDNIKTIAKQMAQTIDNDIPIIYSSDQLEPVSIRWRQQINENSKMLCWHHVIPEMNHNELVGWKKKSDRVTAVFLRTKDDYSRNQHRININKDIIEKLANNVIEIYAKGNGPIEQTLYLVNVGDWVSWYLSEMREVDAVEVDVIDFLKSELAKI